MYAPNIQRCWDCKIEKKTSINELSSKAYDKTEYAISLIILFLLLIFKNIQYVTKYISLVFEKVLSFLSLAKKM